MNNSLIIALLMLLSVGPDISPDQTDHNENPTDLVAYGYSHRVWHGHCYGGKTITDTLSALIVTHHYKELPE